MLIHRLLLLPLALASGCATATPPPPAPPAGPYMPSWVEQLDETREAVLACAAAAPSGARVVNVTPLRDGATGVLLVTAPTHGVMCACLGSNTTLAEIALEPEALLALPQLLVGGEPDHPTQTEVPPHGQRVGWLYWPTREELLGGRATAAATAHESNHQLALDPPTSEIPTP